MAFDFGICIIFVKYYGVNQYICTVFMLPEPFCLISENIYFDLLQILPVQKIKKISIKDNLPR